MAVTLFGIRTEVRLSQLEKAKSPMEVTLSPSIFKGIFISPIASVLQSVIVTSLSVMVQVRSLRSAAWRLAAKRAFASTF
jgi:hypothetical protein